MSMERVHTTGRYRASDRLAQLKVERASTRTFTDLSGLIRNCGILCSSYVSDSQEPSASKEAIQADRPSTSTIAGRPKPPAGSIAVWDPGPVALRSPCAEQSRLTYGDKLAWPAPNATNLSRAFLSRWSGSAEVLDPRNITCGDATDPPAWQSVWCEQIGVRVSSTGSPPRRQAHNQDA
jgi:hypothetical protein